jgi:hypothetical protein
MLRKFGGWLPDRLRQPDYLPPGSVFVDEGRRLSALRPYLTAGLPLSVQSMLKELEKPVSFKEGKQH